MRTTRLLEELIRFPSVTPDQTGALEHIASILAEAGFSNEVLEFEGVKNLYSKFGASSEVILLLGHTDVVPTGDLSNWDTDPFEPVTKDGHLYGRGAADMKGGVSALVVAATEYVKKNADKSIGILLTADEEGLAEYGVKKAAPELHSRGERFRYCLVAEPSSSKKLADTIRVGRRGSLNGKIKIIGKQGHVAFSENALNPIHQCLAPLERLVERKWEADSGRFPATSFQITNISSGTGADNVIPGSLELMVNFRFGTAQSSARLIKAVEKELEEAGVKYEAAWRTSAEPFVSPEGKLINAVCDVVNNKLGYTPELSTGGGTSDARFIAPFGAEIVELGVINQTSHQVNENVCLSDLEQLTGLFYHILERL